jgi:hypothetical protein
MNTDDCLTKTAYELAQAHAYLSRLQAAMEQISAAGIYPAASTERWKDDRYLYLYFRNGAPGLKLDAKQRLYIGADSAKIAEARRLARNRDQHHALNQQARELERWISSLERDIQSLATRAANWPRLHPGTEKTLGLEIAGQPGAAGPNGVGLQNAGSSGAADPNPLGMDIVAGERV